MKRKKEREKREGGERRKENPEQERRRIWKHRFSNVLMQSKCLVHLLRLPSSSSLPF